MIERSQQIQDALPDLRLGTLHFSIEVTPSSEELLQHIATESSKLTEQLTVADLSQMTTISDARAAYRTLGKEPARYRLSAEALLRRVLKGKGLYQINNAVDTLNLISIQSGFSIGGYDLEQIEGEITLGIGQADKPYAAIGRGHLNIENLPILRDEKGAFGSPTSDSQRTMVRPTTKQFLLVFFDFGKDDLLLKTLDDTSLLMKQFAAATLKEKLLF
ncbi:MAG: B3/4 domain-containing protein [Saprospiraceae bacterium]